MARTGYQYLINYHTSGTTNPSAADVELGEIVVFHGTGTEKLVIKNSAGNFVEFLSKASVENLVASAATTLTTANTGHVRVSMTEEEDGHKNYTITGNDIASDSEFKAVSGIVETLSADYATHKLTYEGYYQSVDADIRALSGASSAQAETISTLSGTLETVSGAAHTNETNISSISGSVVNVIGDVEELSGTVGTLETHLGSLSSSTVSLESNFKAVSGTVETLSAETYNIKENYALSSVVTSQIEAAVSAITGDMSAETKTLAYLESVIAENELVTASALTDLDNRIQGIEASTSNDITLESDESATTSGYLKTYVLKQGGVEKGKIDIPKDYLVKSATLETSSADDQPQAGFHAGDKYIDFVINTKDSSGNASHVYLNVADLVDAYTEGDYIDISNENVVSLDSSAVTALEVAMASAHTHANKTVLDGINSTKVSNWDDAAASAHSHANKSILDGISQQDIDNWNAAEYISAVTSTSSVTLTVTNGELTANVNRIDGGTF